jgi:hypothetical protein
VAAGTSVAALFLWSFLAEAAAKAGISGPGISGLAAKVPGFKYLAGAEAGAKAGSEGEGPEEGDVTAIKTMEA